jgi:hypothetical protein
MMMLVETLRIVADMRVLDPTGRWTRPGLREELRGALFSVLESIDLVLPMPERVPPPGARAKREPVLPPRMPPEPGPSIRAGLDAPCTDDARARPFDALVACAEHVFFDVLLATSDESHTIVSREEASFLLLGYARYVNEQVRCWAYTEDIADKDQRYLAHWPRDRFRRTGDATAALEAMPTWGDRWKHVTPAWLFQCQQWNTPDARMPDDPLEVAAPRNVPVVHPLDGESDSYAMQCDIAIFQLDMAYTLNLGPDPGRAEHHLKLAEIIAHCQLLPSALFDTRLPWAIVAPEPIASGPWETRKGAPFYDIEEALQLDRRASRQTRQIPMLRGALDDLARAFEHAGETWAGRRTRLLTIYCDLPLVEAAEASPRATPHVTANPFYDDALVELQRTLLFYGTLRAILSPLGRIAGALHGKSESELRGYGAALRDCLQRMGAQMPTWITSLCQALRNGIDAYSGPSLWGRLPADLVVCRRETLGVELLRAWSQSFLAARVARVHIDNAWVKDAARGRKIMQFVVNAARLLPATTWLLGTVEDEEASRLPLLFASGLPKSVEDIVGDIRLGVAAYAQVLCVLGIPHNVDMASRFVRVCAAENGIPKGRLMLLLDIANDWARPPFMGETGVRRDCVAIARNLVEVRRTLRERPPELSALASLAWDVLLAWAQRDENVGTDEALIQRTMDARVLVNAMGIKFELRTALARANLLTAQTA